MLKKKSLLTFLLTLKSSYIESLGILIQDTLLLSIARSLKVSFLYTNLLKAQTEIDN